MAVKDRPFIVQLFTEAPAWGGSHKVIIIAAHYPHTRDRTSLISALASVATFSGETSTVLIADTNVNSGVSSASLFMELQAPMGSLQSSKLMPTCCLNSGFRDEMAYDRIIANFGSSMSTSMPLDSAPAWAQGEFHLPVRAKLVVPGMAKSSTTTTTMSTSTITSTTTTISVSTLTTTTTTTTASTTTQTSTTTTTTVVLAPLVFLGFATVGSCSLAFLVFCGIVFGCKFVGSGVLFGQSKLTHSESMEKMIADCDLADHQLDDHNGHGPRDIEVAYRLKEGRMEHFGQDMESTEIVGAGQASPMPPLVPVSRSTSSRELQPQASPREPPAPESRPAPPRLHQTTAR